MKATQAATGNSQVELDFVTKDVDQKADDSIQRTVTGETVHNVVDSRSNVDYKERVGLDR